MNIQPISFGRSAVLSRNYNQGQLRFTPDELTDEIRALDLSGKDDPTDVVEALRSSAESLSDKTDKSKIFGKVVTGVAGTAAFAATVLSFRRAMPFIRKTLGGFASKVLPNKGAKGIESLRKAADSLGEEGAALQNETLRLIGKFLGKDANTSYIKAAGEIVNGKVASDVVDFANDMAAKIELRDAMKAISKMTSENAPADEVNKFVEKLGIKGKYLEEIKNFAKDISSQESKLNAIDGDISIMGSVAKMIADKRPPEALNVFVNKSGLKGDELELVRKFTTAATKENSDVRGLVADITKDADIGKFIKEITSKDPDKDIFRYTIEIADDLTRPTRRFQGALNKVLGDKHSKTVASALEKVGIETGTDVVDAAAATGVAILAGREAADISDETQKDAAIKSTIRNVAKIANTVGVDVIPEV